MSETFLDSSIDLNDENINIDGYSILRVDHPNNNKRGGVCIYFKPSLPLIRKDDLSAMQETIATEISVENEPCFFTCFYRSPSQNHDELENFCSELNLLLTNINNQPEKFTPQNSLFSQVTVKLKNMWKLFLRLMAEDETYYNLVLQLMIFCIFTHIPFSVQCKQVSFPV